MDIFSAKKAVVVPSIRPHLWRKFVEHWAPRLQEATIYFVSSSIPEEFCGFNEGFRVVDLDTADRFGARDIIQDRSSAIRALGFLAAYSDGAEEILSLDDDCMPDDSWPMWFHSHRVNAWVPCNDSSCKQIKARGTPYGDRPIMFAPFNMGRWNIVPDWDAPHQLAHPDAKDQLDLSSERTKIIPTGQFVPICGMNVWFKAEALPVYYFPIMPYAGCRMDDIWAGAIAKRACDLLCVPFTIGGPCVNHERMSDPIDNLVAEAEGIRMHEEFWYELFSKPILLQEWSWQGAARSIGAFLHSNSWSERYGDYFRSLGSNLLKWAEVVKGISRDDV